MLPAYSEKICITLAASFEVGAQRDHPSSYQGGSPPYIRELYASTPTHVDDYGVKNPESRVVLNAKSRIAAAKRSSPSNRRCDKRYEMLGMIQIKVDLFDLTISCVCHAFEQNSRPIASLVVQPTVANSSVDQNQTKKLLVDASESTQTPFLLVSSDGSCYSTGRLQLFFLRGMSFTTLKASQKSLSILWHFDTTMPPVTLICIV